MRFIHVSDVRLGASPDSDKSWGRERALEIRETFRKVVDKTAEEGCDLLLISGNLFCHQPVSAELEELNRLFLVVPGTEVVITAGKLDAVRKNAPVRSFQWAPNVHYVTDEVPALIRFPGLNTAVLAMSSTEGGGAASAARIVEAFSGDAAPKEAVRILLCRDEALCAEGAEKTLRMLTGGISYAAIGGAEAHRELLPMKAASPGSPEPLSMAESGEQGVYMGDISTATGRMIGLSFVPTACAAYIPLLIHVNERTEEAELLLQIRREIEKRGEKNIYRLRIAGKRSPETEFSFREIERQFRISEVSDETEPQYDFPALFAEHPQDMIGFYISSLMKERKEMSALEKKAMYYGIHALLCTAEKR